MDELRRRLYGLQLREARGDTSAALERADVERQLRRAVFQAWLEHAMETLSMPTADRYARDDEGQRLWEVCLEAGWTQEEGKRAIDRERGDYDR